jgi:hypothetical protein
MHYHGADTQGTIDEIIELPDLFEGEGLSGAPEGPTEQTPSTEQGPLRNVLMITKSPFLKGLLVSIFEREGCALTSQNKPALIMTLLDAGFDDVFAPPFNYELISARMSKSLVAQEQQGRGAQEQAGFGGTFRELPFVDLMQALGLRQRSCEIRLEGNNGHKAKIYMRDGQRVFAECGEFVGVEAVYAAIRWREEGAFQIGTVTEYPAENMSLPNDFVLMEGCRLLDEGRLP